MKFITNNKGMTFAPYLMIVFMLLGMLMAFHFLTVDTEKTIAISEEGKMSKDLLAVEGLKSSVRNAILLSAYDYIDKGLNHPELQKPTLNVKDNGLQKYLQDYIAYDLDNTRPGFGAWTVSINQKDDQGKIMSDGFLVSAESGSDKVEKFVDANAFNLIKYANDEDSTYYKERLRYKLEGLMAYKMQRTLSGVKCGIEGVWVWPSYQEGIVCRNYDYSDEDVDDNQFCSDDPGRVSDGWRSSNCWEDRDVKPFMREAGETSEKIKEALIDAQRTIAKGDLPGDYPIGELKSMRDNNINLKLDIKKVTVSTTVKCTDGVWCCDEGKSGCLTHDQDWLMSLVTSGSITVEATVISQAEIKEDDSTAGNFEICYKNPIMNKKGDVIPLTVKKEYTIPYSISISYRLDCHPDYLTIKRDHDCEAKTTSASIENIMSFTDKEDSLKYTLETPKCEGGSTHPHVGGPDPYTMGAGLDVLKEYKGGKYLEQCSCGGRYHLE